MRKRKLLNRIICLLLCVSMLLPYSGDSVVYATDIDGMKVSNTSEAEESDSGTVGSISGGTINLCPAIYVSIVMVDVVGTTSTDVRKNIYNAICKCMKEGRTVLAGKTRGQYQLFSKWEQKAASLDDRRNVYLRDKNPELEEYEKCKVGYKGDLSSWTDEDKACKILEDFYYNILQGKLDEMFPASNIDTSQKNYEDLLKALSKDAYDKFKKYKTSGEIPVVLFTLGEFDYHANGSNSNPPVFNWFKPKDLVKTWETTWRKGYKTFDDFVTASIDDGCNIDVGNGQNPCKQYFGSHKKGSTGGHYLDFEEYFPWHGICEVARTAYITYEGLNYYGRGYVFPYGIDPVKESAYVYDVTVDPAETVNAISTEENGDTFTVHLYAGDGKEEKNEKGELVKESLNKLPKGSKITVEIKVRTLANSTAADFDDVDTGESYNKKSVSFTGKTGDSSPYKEDGSAVTFSKEYTVSKFLELLGKGSIDFSFNVLPKTSNGMPLPDMKHAIKVSCKVTDNIKDDAPTTTADAVGSSSEFWFPENQVAYAVWRSNAVVPSYQFGVTAAEDDPDGTLLDGEVQGDKFKVYLKADSKWRKELKKLADSGSTDTYTIKIEMSNVQGSDDGYKATSYTGSTDTVRPADPVLSNPATSGRPSTKLKYSADVSASALYRFTDGNKPFSFTFNVSSKDYDKSETSAYMLHKMKFDVTIVGNSGATKVKATPSLELGDNKWDINSSTNYCSWEDFIIPSYSSYKYCVSATPKNKEANSIFNGTYSDKDTFAVNIKAGKDTIKNKNKLSANITVKLKLTTVEKKSISSVSLSSVEFPSDVTYEKKIDDITYKFDKSNFFKLVDGNHPIKYKYNVNMSTPASDVSKVDMRHTVKVKLDIVDGMDETTITAMSSDDKDWNTSSLTTFANWYAEKPVRDPVHIEWDYSTSENPNAYAEIVANCVGTKSGTIDGLASDWNVSQGVPSTENLAIGVGGTCFMVDLAGMIHGYGSSIPNGSSLLDNSDNTVNSENTNAPIKRNIVLKVHVTNYWGDANERCTLSCSGNHTVATCDTNSAGSVRSSKPADFPLDEKGNMSNYNGSTDGNWECKVCGQTFHWTYSGGTDYKEEKTKDIYDDKGNYKETVVTSPEVLATAGFWSPDNHTCTATVTFNCQTGTYSTSGACSGTTSSSKKSANNQRYISNSGDSWTTAGGFTMPTTLYTDEKELCEGYTSGYGCVSSDKHNCEHSTTETRTFKIVETIDMYAYREITAAKVYGLTSAQVTSVDSSLITNDISTLKTSNIALSARVWHAAGAYTGKNGRVWFTQFKNPTYVGGWTSTDISNTSGTNSFAYWVGDVQVDLYTVADTYIADLANPDAVDQVSGFSNKRGIEKKHYVEAGSDTASTTTFTGRKGDKMTSDQVTSQALQVVNAYQWANKDNYSAVIISDACDVYIPYREGVTQADGAQNILNETYGIDAGIPLFNCGFSTSVKTYYRNHKNAWANNAEDMQKLVKSRMFWDKYDDLGSLNNPELIGYGYTGVPSSDPSEKYKSYGNMRNYYNTLITCLGRVHQLDGKPNASRLTDSVLGYTKNGEKWFVSGGSISSNAPSCYIERESFEGAHSGITRGVIDIAGTKSSQSYNGYYTKYSYPNMGTFNVESKISNDNYAVGTPIDTVYNNGIDNLTAYTNADGSTINYKNAMVISNINMRNTARNGKYTSPMKVAVNYSVFFEFMNGTQCRDCEGYTPEIPQRKTSYNAKYSRNYTASMLNDVVVHDPVSTQYWQVIGNSYGDYDGNGPAIDESKEDFRDSTRGLTEKEKTSYGVIGNTFHLWVTDFGDFYDGEGSVVGGEASTSLGLGCTLDGADTSTGAINSGAKGYVNNMNCNRWVSSRHVKFAFPVGVYSTDGTYYAVPSNTWIDLSTIRCNTLTGYSNDINNGWHKAPSALNNFTDKDEEFKYGLDFEFTILTSATEVNSANIFVRTIAINDGGAVDNNIGEPVNRVRENNFDADSAVDNDFQMSIIGRIGNIALEDVGDFRYSNLFKKAKSTWMLDGVVHEVDSNNPINIFATEYDIVGDKRNNTTYNSRTHSTLSVTDYSYNGVSGLGKAGYWKSLPMSAASNNLVEFTIEQTRLGYPAFFDIETIGNYYGRNYIRDEDGIADPVYNDGPKSVNDESLGDTRSNVMSITPYYYLYDYSEDKFYAVDLYSGSKGKYTKFYSSTDPTNIVHSAETGLYIDLPNELGRRNVPELELTQTSKILNADGFNKAAYLSSDYIGTSMGITLDASDLDYIGSNKIRNSFDQLRNVAGSTQEGLSSEDFTRQSQRWYFTLSVPSSTILTYPSVGTNQKEIIKSNEKLKAEHPNSVLVTFADISVVGEVNRLNYNAKNANGGRDVTFTLFGDAKPSGWKSTYTNTVTMRDEVPGKGRQVYFADGRPATTIPQKLMPLIVYDPFNTSNTDKDTYGTH